MKRLYVLLALSVGAILLPTYTKAVNCDQTFYGTLRQGKQYTFKDDFSANGSDKWLRKRAWEYDEQYDYNNSSDFPEFNWTDELKNNDYKVGKNQTMTVIKADRTYPIYSVPASRSYDNFLIKYTLTYSTDEAGNNKYTHTECKYYEISRCGDGVVDSSYGEKCDPKDTSKTGWGNGGCDNSCNPVTAEQPVCNSTYNGQRLSNLTESASLCTKGTVSEFKYNESTHRRTWKCNNVAGQSTDCSATKPYCGDGTKDAGETCDPKDPNKTGWGNGGCDNSCNPITIGEPVCNSSYNGQRVTSLVEGNYLCTEGTVSEFKYNESTHKWTWKCNNTLGKSTDCSATKPYCGDGTKDAGETCDPKDPNKTGWGNGGCDNSCNPITIGEPVCNSSYNGQRVTSLVEGNYLCAEGTVSEFKYNESTHKWTWKCNNTLGKSTDCSATKPYCGDGTKDAGETCDPKDPNKTGWGEEGCSDSCEAVNSRCGDGKKNGNEECDPKDPNKEGWSDLGCDASCHQITVPSGCDETFYETLRYGHKYTFYDDFHANVGDKWLWKWVMEYEEQYDYNKSPDFPQFARTTDLVNANYRVASNTTMRVLQATSAYPILAVPAQRAYDNLFIKYTLTYSTDAAGSDKQAHSECMYYEISRCGDGVLDTEYDEICDPKDPNKTGWGNGGCDDTCNPITVVEPDGKLKIEKTLVGSKEVKNTGDIITWNVKVTAEDGDVTNFIVTDKLPDILAYDSYTVIHNPGLTVGNPTVNGNNIVWKVTGTLKEGEYLEIQLKTKAKWMPKEDIVNVACVRPENDPDEDCDEDDIPVDGKLKIEKTLVGSKEVKNTGDIITWNIKVTAVDGNVTNFIVTDKLPDILAYDSYTVIHNPGLTVGNPTVNGNNIVWKVTGTLKEGEYLEIQLKTKAKWMPKEDIVNVACVRPENDPDEDCDEDDIPVGGKLKIEKTLVGSKEVKNVGDIITWNIKVTAVGGDVTNFIITDKLPEILGYSGYEVAHTGSVDSIMFGGENMAQNSVSWTVKGTLKENDYVEITLITYAKVMPEKDYKNVACVAPEDNPKDEDCDDEELPSPHIRIKKSFTDGSKTKTVKIGEEIGYKITFGNTGNASATITSIKDFLPKNVEYVTGAIFLEGQSNHENTVGGEIIDILRGVHYNRTVDGVYIDIYTGITLKPGESGYIILTGKILTGNQDSRTNFACIYLNDKKVDCDDATHDLGEDMCEKLDVPAGNLPSGGGSKDVTCTTTSGAVAEYIEIDCGNGASGNRYITGSNIKSLTGTCSYPSGEKTYSLVCKVKIDGKEYSSDSCKGTVKVNGGGGGSSCFVAGTKITMADGSKKNIEDVKIGEKLLGENGEINTVIGYDRPVLGSRHLWSINGGEYFVSDEHPFKTTEGWKSFNPEMTKLEVDLDTTQLKIGDTLVTNNGLEVIETVDYINADYNTPLYNFVLDGNHTYYADSYLVHNKDNPPSPGGGGRRPTTDYCEKHSDSLECNLADEHCFNVNGGNFSVEYGEILPVYLNVYREKESGYTYKYTSNEDCNPGEVNLASLKCKIRILRPDNNEVAYTSEEFDCLSRSDQTYTDTQDPLIKYRAITQKNYYDIDPFDAGAGKYRPTIKITNSTGWNIKDKQGKDILGEYKFQIALTKYEQCGVDSNGDGDGWKPIDLGDEAAVCQSNFVLTDSYTVQKTPSGNLTASTEKLDEFKQVDGSTVGGLKTFASYLNAIATSEYHPNDTVNKAKDVFINKYKKLAVRVDISKSKFLSSDVEVKKVPGKHIYFVDGDIVVKGGRNNIKTPFTIVQTSGNTTISGNVNHNMMLLTKGNIIFKGDCTNNQDVKGIFYAQGNLSRTGVLHNDNTKNKVWCTQGGLNIKGVLIGNSFNNLMNDSRSHLEYWFDANKGGKNAKTIMNGGSVVIEYSPSIFTKGTMPPGAEDFTTALSIYKN